MRRLDHAAIYVLIAGTYTPFAMALDAESRRTMLLVAWGGAAAGAVQSLFWAHAPKAVSAVLYVALGWAMLPFAGRLAAVMGAGGIALLVAGGLAYTLGAVVYARRHWRPGELIAPGTMRVLELLEPTRDGALPVLLVEPVEIR